MTHSDIFAPSIPPLILPPSPLLSIVLLSFLTFIFLYPPSPYLSSYTVTTPFYPSHAPSLVFPPSPFFSSSLIFPHISSLTLLFPHHSSFSCSPSLCSVLNGRISRELGFEKTFVPPGPGDEGIAVGCALYGLQVRTGSHIRPCVRCYVRSPPLRLLMHSLQGAATLHHQSLYFP